MTKLRLTLFIGAVAIGALAFAACGGDDGGGGAGTGGGAAGTGGGAGGGVAQACKGDVNVTLSDFTIELDTRTVSAGEVTLCIDNLGPSPHELKVVRTDLEPNKLPVIPPFTSSGSVDESKVEILGETIAFRRDEPVQSVTVTLQPGTYVLIDNIPGYYQLGMRTTLTAE